MNDRIVVVGAGVIGLTTAWFLHREGAKVILVDERAAPAAGASFANGGLITPSFSEPWNSPGVFWQLLRWIGDDSAPLLLRPAVLPSLLGWGMRFIAASRPARFERSVRANAALSLYSAEVLDGLRCELGHGRHKRTSSLKIFRSETAARESMARADIYRAMGIRLDPVDRAAMLEIEPALAPVADALVGALHCPLDDAGDARRFALEIDAKLAARGVERRFGEKVRAFAVRPDGVEIRTDDGPLAADRVVIAGGAWSDALTRPTGVRLALAPVKGYSISVPIDAAPRPVVPVLDEAFHAVATPLGSVMRVAGTAEFAGFDDRLRPNRIANLITLLGHIYPAMAAGLHPGAVSGWTGFRPTSADGVPFIGPTRMSRLFVNSGHGPLGWTMAAGSARLLVDLMSGRQPAISPAAFHPERS